MKNKNLLLIAALLFGFAATADESDFAHKVPEPVVARTQFVQMNSPRKVKSKAKARGKAKQPKVAKHSASPKQNKLRLAKHKKSVNKGRSIASVSTHKKSRTLAKRGHGSKSRVR